MAKRELPPIHPGEILLEEFLEPLSLTPLVYGRATNRSVLGSMRDHAQLAKDCLRDGESLWDAMLFLAKAPSGPLDYESPDRVAPRLVENTWRGPRPVA